MVDAFPRSYPNLMVYLTPCGAAEAIQFYQQVFGAEVRMRMPGPNNTVGHAELAIGESRLMLADEPDGPIGYKSPKSLGGTSFGFALFVDDVDAVYNQAIAAGASSISPPETKFYGDREGRIRDPFGYVWSLLTHIEDVSFEEMAKRAAAAM